MKKRLSIPLEILISIMFLLIIAMIWPGKILYRKNVESTTSEIQLEPAISLTEGSEFIAEFVPTHKILNGISFKLHTNGGQCDENGSVILKVYDSDMQMLTTTYDSIGNITDSNYHYFYTNISLTPGNTYYYSLESIEYGEFPVLLYASSAFAGSPEYRSLRIDGVSSTLAPSCSFVYYTGPSLKSALPLIIAISLVALLILVAVSRRKKILEQPDSSPNTRFIPTLCKGIFLLIILMGLLMLSNEGDKTLKIKGNYLDKSVGTRTNDTLYITESNNYSGTFARSETYALPKGTYTLGVEYKNDNINDSVTIWTNHKEMATYHLTPELKYQTFRFTLDQDTEEVRLTFSFGGTGVLTLFNYTLTADNGFYQDVYMFAALLLLTFILFFAYKYLNMKGRLTLDTTTKQTHIILVVVSLAASLPLMTTALKWGDDIAYHLVRIEGIKDGLRDGQFPVLIYPEGMDGQGYLNAMYPNLFLYIPAFLRLCGVSIANSYKALLILSNFATVYLTYYSVKSITKERRTAIFASAIYVLAPYHFTNSYARAALGETLAMVFIPVFLAGLYHLIISNRKHGWMLIVGLSGLIQTHILSTLIAGILCVIVGIIYLYPLIREKKLLYILKLAAITIVINLWFIVPFIYYYIFGDLYTTALDWSKFYEYSIYLSAILSTSNLVHCRALSLGIPVAAFLIFAFIYLAEKKSKEDAAEVGMVRFLSIITVVLVFMTTCHFAGMELLNLLPFNFLLLNIQFPWRLLGFSTAMAIVVGSIALNKSTLLSKHKTLIGIVLLTIAVLTSVPAYSEEMPYKVYTDTYTQGHHSKIVGIEKGDNTIVYPYEWRPNCFDDEIYANNEIQLSADSIQITDYERRGTTTTFSYINESKDQSVILPIAYYPGYQIRSENNENISFGKTANGQLRIGLSDDGIEHTYTIEFKGKLLFTLANLISLCSIIAIVVIPVIKRKMKKTKNNTIQA